MSDAHERAVALAKLIEEASAIGQIGLTTTPLRPTGKARFGDLIVDATAQTGALEHNQSVEVVATRGLRVIVRDVRSPDSRLIERSSDPFQFDEDLFKS